MPTGVEELFAAIAAAAAAAADPALLIEGSADPAVLQDLDFAAARAADTCVDPEILEGDNPALNDGMCLVEPDAAAGADRSPAPVTGDRPPPAARYGRSWTMPEVDLEVSVKGRTE